MPSGDAYCGSCGSALGRPESQATRTLATEVLGPASDRLGLVERFTPGQIVAGRYRIIGPLGHGGMGEVFRADDLRLGQPVALKFLPERVVHSNEARRHLLDEVRLARQVSHPNVCRVYDVGELDTEGRGGAGQLFLSMEYIDGEDLASLISRIDRLPVAKGLQVARQLCLGLAAVHDRGVLHCDLKPANVMIDGRGQVRITDFGVAGLREGHGGKGAAARGGTPRYMAPEQLLGGTASVRSDLYSLGLVLAEIFTGASPLPAGSLAELASFHARGEPPLVPGAMAEEVDASIEEAILACLHARPEDRPASALAVARALPGGDPLSDALAAGETPSPELVVLAGSSETLPIARIVALVTVLVLCIAVVAAANDRIALFSFVSLDKAPAVLIDRAVSVLDLLGPTPRDPPVDHAWGLFYNEEVLEHLRAESGTIWQWTAKENRGSFPVEFWYRESPWPLNPAFGEERVTALHPPVDRPGMSLVRLDPSGRLLEVYRQPSAGPPGSQAPTVAEADWAPLFRAAGLDAESFERVEPPASRLPIHTTTRTAWRSTRDAEGAPIEGARAGEEIVYFGWPGPWLQVEEIVVHPGRESLLVVFLLVPLVFAPLAGAAVLARRNLRAGRCDRRGAMRVAILAAGCFLVNWVLVAERATPLREYDRMFAAVADALLEGAVVWLVYIAVEPHVRRRWPRALVAWSLVLAGRWRDPSVGREALFGVAFGGAAAALYVAACWLAVTIAPESAVPRQNAEASFWGVGPALGVVADDVGIGVGLALLFTVSLLLLREKLERRWLSRLVFALFWLLGTVCLGLVLAAWGTGLLLVQLPVAAVLFAAVFAVATRFGVLSLAVAIFSMLCLVTHPLTLDPGAWYAPNGAVAIAAVAALAVLAVLAGTASSHRRSSGRATGSAVRSV